jgi:uncharacterized membrane protein YkoI
MNEKMKGVAVTIAVIAALAIGGAAIAGATGGGSSQQSAAEPPESSEPAGQSDANESESASENESASDNEAADNEAAGNEAADNEGAGNEGADAAEGPDQPVTGSALQKASAVALHQTNGGKVTDSEVNDEQGYYEIEVTRDDGSQVDVHLDRSFHVINSESDGGDE